MDLSTKNPKPATPVKKPHGFHLHSKLSENVNPNLCNSSPGRKPANSPLNKSAQPQKSASKDPTLSQNPVLYSPRNKIRERKFVVAKKTSKKERTNSDSNVDCKCKERLGENVKKCLCVAYETLRASQDEFFKSNNGEMGEEKDCDFKDESEVEKQDVKTGFIPQNLETEDGDRSDNQSSGQIEQTGQTGSSTIKRRREKLLEEARKSAPESGKVMHLVQAFERLLSIPSSKDYYQKEEKEIKESKKKAMQWPLPGLQHPKVPETQISSSSFTLSEFQPPEGSSDYFLTSENLGLDSRLSVSSSWGGSQSSISSRSSNGGRRSRRNSSKSCGTMGNGRRWKKKQLKVTRQKPFELRTEQRGRMKEEEFMKKVQEMMVEEEKQRIPIAQGLPWTTDEPECLVKPPVKENTRPVDLKLHSDVRAMERAEFDHQVAEKMSLIEQYKMERERQQKLAEEEEVCRLRKELIPKAQAMPYFDRPFIPRRSMKHPTVPREPKFHIPQHKKIKCCISWNDISTYSYQQ